LYRKSGISDPKMINADNGRHGLYAFSVDSPAKGFTDLIVNLQYWFSMQRLQLSFGRKSGSG
jgi:hypothetical protein